VKNFEKWVVSRLRPYTELLLWMRGENPHMSSKEALRAINRVQSTLLSARALANDETIPPTEPTNKEQADGETQQELPWRRSQ